MKRKILSGLLMLAMLISLIPAAVLPASAVSEFTPSDDVIEYIKKVEGFSATAHWDNSQWSIGYGTTSTAGATITREEAEVALRQSLVKVSEALNTFIDNNKLNLTQSQFDALVSLSFNCGTGWTNQSGRFRTAVLNGATGNEFLFALSLWANVGSVPEPGLLKRRMSEANMYLNGEYSVSMPKEYTYVIFDPNGGTPGTGGEDKMQGYDQTGTAPIMVADPTKSGASFLGWYTNAVGGTKVTELSSSTAEATLFAHWSDGSAQSVVATGTVKCDTNVNVRKGAGTGYAIVGRGTNGTELSFYEIKTVGSTKWGRFSSGWICLDYVTMTSSDSSWSDGKEDSKDDNSSNMTAIATGKVSSKTNLNVRSGAGTNYALVKSLKPGTQVSIYEKKSVNGVQWGRIDSANWVCLTYVTLDKDDSGSSNGSSWSDDNNSGSSSNMTAIATGKVSSKTNLNVRSGAGTNYALVKSLKPGTQVSIYEKKSVNGVQWGRIDSANWVCLSYVTLDKDSNSSDGTTETALDTGKVSSTTALNVRSGAGTNYTRVKTLTPGTKVSIYEKKTVNGTQWGRIDKNNWVCLDYVTLDSADNDSASNTDTVTGTVTSSNGLIIRKAAGTQNAMVGYYVNGASITILEQKTVGGVNWGRTDKGWVCMTYVKTSGSGSSGLSWA